MKDIYSKIQKSKNFEKIKNRIEQNDPFSIENRTFLCIGSLK